MTVIGVVGGTGPQGRGLGYRFAQGGHQVVLGSRTEERATEAAARLNERLSGAGSIQGAENGKAAQVADIVMVTTSFDGYVPLVRDLAAQLASKTVVSCVNPIRFDEQGPYSIQLDGGSVAEEIQALVPTAGVVGAFHTLSAARLLKDEDGPEDEDVLVCSDHPTAKDEVMNLAATVTGTPGIDAGALRVARDVEPLTTALLSINKRYKVRSGITISGLHR